MQIMVHFDNEVSDVTKALVPTRIYIGWIVYHGGMTDQVYLSNKDDLNNSYDRCIWDTCSGKFLEWMRDQPYSRLYGREKQPSGGKGLAFIYKIVLIPYL